MNYKSIFLIISLTKALLLGLVMPLQINENSTACLEPKAAGLCRGKLLRYAYDDKSGNCISFNYSGCGATQNNFLTYEECRRDCMQQLRY